jgi:hypothetical protein
MLRDALSKRFYDRAERAQRRAVRRKDGSASGRAAAEVRTEIAELDAEVRAELRTEIAGQRTELLRWMFAFWVTNFIGIAGLLIALCAQ